ncbi:cytochrome c oxidase assembly protein [Paraburkholderia dilworthii]|uniref:cytochrome c oxidase assembly protein n=1 Tax=Paraburkholderia dilworthii TaxID=948106 RepID=UPI0003F7DE80|nr:cytochrome c oxidase assembly protein [Paraburkholderia dilworthii]
MAHFSLRAMNTLTRCVLALGAACIPLTVEAHVLSAAERSAPPVLRWTFEPWVVVLLIISLGLYAAGYRRLCARSRRGRGIRVRQLCAFVAGWLALVAALDSPLDALSAALFSAHMVQHELMMIVAAPLLVLGRPLAVWLWAFPPAARHAIAAAVRTPVLHGLWRALCAPAAAWLLHAAALWVWHMPRFFEAALASDGIHTFQHASFLLSALLFWWVVFGEGARRNQSGYAMLSLFTTMVHTGALGALLTLAPGLWYPAYIEPTSALGFDPLQDQQLGGLVMWVPGGLAYLIAALLTGARWLMHRAPATLMPATLAAHRDSSS